MNSTVPPQAKELYVGWSRALTGLLCLPLSVAAYQLELGSRLLGAMSATRRPEQPAGTAEDIEARARARAAAGFAPPREIYDAQNRRLVDWLSFPQWARPSDPELFEGPHEG